MDFRARIDPEWQKNLPRDPREFGPKDGNGGGSDDRLMIGTLEAMFDMSIPPNEL